MLRSMPEIRGTLEGKKQWGNQRFNDPVVATWPLSISCNWFNRAVNFASAGYLSNPRVKVDRASDGCPARNWARDN